MRVRATVAATVLLMCAGLAACAPEETPAPETEVVTVTSTEGQPGQGFVDKHMLVDEPFLYAKCYQNATN